MLALRRLLFPWTILGEKIDTLIQEIRDMSPKLQQLADAVNQQTQVVGSVVTLINGLVAEIQAAKDDPAEIDRLVGEVQAATSQLASAVQANTPSAPSDPNAPAPSDATTATTGNKRP